MAAPAFGTNPDLLFIWYPVLFIVLMAGLLILFIRTLEKFTKAEIGINNVSYNLAAYMGFLFFYNFVNSYFEDAFMLDIMGTFLYPLGFILIFIPLIGLVFSWIKNRGVE